MCKKNLCFMPKCMNGNYIYDPKSIFCKKHHLCLTTGVRIIHKDEILTFYSPMEDMSEWKLYLLSKL